MTDTRIMVDERPVVVHTPEQAGDKAVIIQALADALVAVARELFDEHTHVDAA